ncbi:MULTISPECIES: hypothetical protein [unclassified Pseudomonas]|uniref:hypothetical protein n=1 Tax=unclassified Pseudomonas TaxID=196821 RepID=UPI00222F67F6|nr:hypothetical protein [Pseudomonas sp. B21-053]UZE13104.1 hypothetical protein LOY68_05705 [Pseudomonas sp. B21-053]
MLETTRYLIGTLIKLMVFVAALSAFIVALVYLTDDSTSPKMVPLLNTLITTANEHRVSYFQNQDWCESLLSETGNYATSEISTCGGGETKPFDAQGTQLFNTIRSAAKKAKISPIRISLKSEHGTVSFAQISLPCLLLCNAKYVYSPHKPYVSEERKPTTVTDMTGGWYYEIMGI